MARKLKADQRPYWVAAVTAAVVLLAVLVIDQSEIHRFPNVRDARILRSLSTVRARVETEINERLFLTRSLVAYVSSHPDISGEEFQSLARLLFDQRGKEGVRSIQLAKDTVVAHVYPFEDNREAMGLRLLEHPQQRRATQRALDIKGTVVAGRKINPIGNPGMRRTSASLLNSRQAVAGETAGDLGDDTVITTDVKAKLAADKSATLTRVGVDTHSGVVQLSEWSVRLVTVRRRNSMLGALAASSR